MIEKVDMYIVRCDRCNVKAFEESEFSAWGDEEQARGEAIEAQWEEVGEKIVCPNCWECNEDEGKIIIKPPIPTP